MSKSRKTQQLEAHARGIAQAIGGSLPENVGFALLLFDFGEDGTMSWISNAQRDDMVKALREMLNKFEAGEQDDPHI